MQNSFRVLQGTEDDVMPNARKMAYGCEEQNCKEKPNVEGKHTAFEEAATAVVEAARHKVAKDGKKKLEELKAESEPLIKQMKENLCEKKEKGEFGLTPAGTAEMASMLRSFRTSRRKS